MKILPILHRLARFGLLAVLLPVALARGAELLVFAAASLSDALQEIARHYSAADGDQIRFNFAASSLLERQIQEGAPADVFFSADEAKMDALDRAGMILPHTRRSLLSNTLVLVVNAAHGVTIARPADLARPQVHRLAIAEPQTVPAGIYAREWLARIGWWDRISPKVVATANVRACLAAVATGDADAGIVYQTDALISPKVAIAWKVAPADAPRISYPVAVIKTTHAPQAARRFVRYLASAEARSVFARFGFLTLPTEKGRTHAR